MAKGDSAVIKSIAEEFKKVSYLGAAGPYLVFGANARSVVDGATIIVIATVWFIIWQIVAHFLVSLAQKLEVDNG